MFLIRQSRPEDVGTLLKLARMVYFINLPPDEKVIARKIQHSRECFLRLATEVDAGGSTAGGSGHYDDLYMFTIVDIESGLAIGTSQVKAHMGGPGNPNYAFSVFTREFTSTNLGIGSRHLVGRLYADESGPTEVGGLILDPGLRGHKARPGRLISFIRFHFIGLHRAIFSDRLIAEMMASVTADGDNLFWDHFGRKFIPVKYSEADRFCQHNRTFIDELLPKEDIYLSLFPLEVLNQIGQVSKETVPARRLLERLGFEYKNFIDPFDGGPHLEAAAARVPLIASTRRTVLGDPYEGGKSLAKAPVGPCVVSVLRPDGEFAALEVQAGVDPSGKVRIPKHAADQLQVKKGDTVGFTPMDFEPVAAGDARPTAKPTRKKRAT
ncbi:MAG: arginine N-succinyltransferase [Phycisphaeraceae bacterium]|nr:MAG: arginine N-succinyltransferase [Phycisphaeraceae bacterium]